MHFYLDHDWVEELGEQLPIYRPPLDMSRLFGEPRLGGDGAVLTVRYLTPHSKWSIHSEYQDNLLMLSLSRGGPTMWMSVGDAAKIAARDNDWVERSTATGWWCAERSSVTGCPTASYSSTTPRSAPSTRP
ncbi:molybdopterin dinucleotide binding domain protein [Mycobacterium kansasii 824]|nr:molybdopterin dinucleotide binding domain protein [Mycobacterium kansasii 824]